MPGAAARDRSEGRIEGMRDLGGVFVEAVRATRLPMVLTDPTLPGDPIVFANQAFLDLSGYAMDEVLGRQPHFMNGPDSGPEDVKRFRDVLSNDHDGIVETVQYAKDGRRFVAVVLLSAFKGEDGRTLHHFLTWTDVTRRVDAGSEATQLRTARIETRDSEQRQSFLLALTDALRPIGHAAETMETASRMLGEWLGVDRVAYAETLEDGEHMMVSRDWAREGVPSVVGTYKVVNFGEFFNDSLAHGELATIEDAPAQAGMTADECARTWAAIGVRAAVAHPIVKEGKLCAALFVHSAQPREWTARERNTIVEVAERTWAAVERTRAEAKSRESEARLSAAFESVPVGVAVVDLDGVAITSNAEYQRFLPSGVIPSRDPARLARWRAWDPESRPLEPSQFPGARALRGETVVPGQGMLFTNEDGREIWTCVATLPFRSATGEVEGIVTTISNIDTVKRSGEALQESEQRLRLIVENAQDYAIFTTDPEGTITDWREGAEAVFRYPREEILGQSCDILFTPEDREAGQPDQERAAAAATGKAPDVRWHLRKGGARVFIDGVSTALRSPEGELIGFLKIGQDVTERHASEQRQELLLAELQHRVRNTLGMVRSMVRFTAEGHDDIDDFTAHLIGRLDALARTQVVLTRTAGARIDLESMVWDELEVQSVDEQRVKVAGPEIRLSPKAAEVLSLALHELATNSLKYGALADPDGRLTVKWERTSRGDKPWLRLDWEERSSHPRAEPARVGFGTELIQERVPYELNGEASLRIADDGVKAEIAFPLTEGASILETAPVKGSLP